MIPVAEIEALARNALRDAIPGIKAYSDEEFLMYLNSATRWVVSLDSTASVVTESVALTQGTHQALPEKGLRVMEFWNNDSGNVRARIDGRLYKGADAVREVPLSEMRSTVPQWASARESQIVVNVIFNKDDPKHFMVYPPNDGNGKLMLTYTKEPAKVAALTDIIDMSEVYANALANYVVYKALVRRDEGAGEGRESTDKAEFFYTKAVTALQAKSMADEISTPEDTAGM